MIKVLYIIGKGRSGSTLVANVLGQFPGVVSVGELLLLYTRGFLGGFRCGCGMWMANCNFWTKAIETGFSDIGPPDPIEMARLHERVLKWTNVPRLMVQRTGHAPSWRDLARLVDVTGRLYQGIAEVSGARVIVDSSKWPAAPTPLGLLPNVDVRLLHLVRDPRAVVHSWQRQKAQADSGQLLDMPRYGMTYSIASYWARNLTAEAVAARSRWSLRMRYEDFSRDPQPALQEIMQLVEESPASLPVDKEGRIDLYPTHTAGGNPDRLINGETTIRPDVEWVSRQSHRQLWTTTALGLPWLLRYAYPIVPRPRVG